MLWAQPIYNPMSTLLTDYERLLAIVKNPQNCEWHKPYLTNSIEAFAKKHKTSEDESVIDEMRQHLLSQIK